MLATGFVCSIISAIHGSTPVGAHDSDVDDSSRGTVEAALCSTDGCTKALERLNRVANTQKRKFLANMVRGNIFLKKCLFLLLYKSQPTKRGFTPDYRKIMCTQCSLITSLFCRKTGLGVTKDLDSRCDCYPLQKDTFSLDTSTGTSINRTRIFVTPTHLPLPGCSYHHWG